MEPETTPIVQGEPDDAMLVVLRWTSLEAIITHKPRLVREEEILIFDILRV